MATLADGVTLSENRGWSPARVYLAVSAVWHVVLAVGGFLIDQTFPLSVDAARSAGSEHVFGIFETNGWHTLAAAGIGVIATYFAVNRGRAREVALAIGLVHVPITLSLFVWEPHTFLLASNAADQVVHASSAIFGIAAGLLTPADRHATT